MLGSALMGGKASRMASHGRFGDTLLAHLDPMEAELLKLLGGSGTTNPKTGALEFWGGGDDTADGLGGDTGETGSETGDGSQSGDGIGGDSGGAYGGGDTGGPGPGGSESSGFGAAVTDLVDRAAKSIGELVEGDPVSAAVGPTMGMAAKGLSSLAETVGFGLADITGRDKSTEAPSHGGPQDNGSGGNDWRDNVAKATEAAAAADPSQDASPARPKWIDMLFDGRKAGNNAGTPLSSGYKPTPGGQRMTFGSKLTGPAREMAKHGRDGDTLLAHITQDEAELLKSLGGRGTINPTTGALEFAREDNFDKDWYLAQNPDVAAAGVDAWEHYNTMGKTEGRLGNQNEKLARDEGFTGAFGDGAYQTWKSEQIQPFTQNGQVNSSLLGGSITDAMAPGSLSGLQERLRLRQAGYDGGWGEGAANAFTSAYADRDGNPNTVWTAANSSNIDRSGKNVASLRDQIRNLGFEGEWGGNAARDFLAGLSSQYGLDGIGTPEEIVAARTNYDRQSSWEAALQALQERLMELFGQAGQPTTPAAPTSPTLPTPVPAVVPESTVVQAPVYTRPRARVNPWTGAIEYVNDNAATFAAAENPRRRGLGQVISL